MTKIRVYELARELKLESKALLAKLKSLGINAASHQSTLTAAQIEKITAAEAEDSKQKVVVRRRKRTDAPIEEQTELSLAEESSLEMEREAAPVSCEESEEEAKGRDSEFAKAGEDLISEDAGSNRSYQGFAKETSSSDGQLQAQSERLTRSHEHASFVQDMNATLHGIQASQIQKKELDSALDPEAEQARSSAEKAKQRAEEKERAVYEQALAHQRDRNKKPTQTHHNSQQSSASSAPRRQSSFQEQGERRDRDHHGERRDYTDRRSGPQSSGQGSSGHHAHGSSLNQRPSHNQAPKGATIVRKATEQELSEMRTRDDSSRHNKTSRREDSQGVRVTGIGINTRMLDFDPADVSSEKSGRARWGGKDKDKKKTRFEEEEKIAAKAAAAATKKRGAISTRDLLEAAAVDPDELDFDLEQGLKKKRTVYLPQSGKKKDAKKRKELKATQITVPRASYRVVRMDGPVISVAELARQLSVKGTEIIKKLMAQGMMVTLNQNIDFDTTSLIAGDFGFEVKDVGIKADDILSKSRLEGAELETRPPIITVMGHVDHGKTSILDAIRKTDVAAGEAGGITQHIGAYSIEHNGSFLTFLDTPGHEAFSAMRARGAKLTDIVVLVVAADDGVMPQTLEAIAHAKNAKVPIIVAVNKIDKPNKNLDRIYAELAEHGIQSEEWGGENQFVKVSALKREGIDDLLEAILIQAEVLELRASPKGFAEGSVVEAHLDKGRGPVATMIVTQGTLNNGDYIVAGAVTGRVRAMFDHHGKKVSHALPSFPVQVIGLTATPMSGDAVHTLPDEKTCREVAQIRLQSLQAAKNLSSPTTTLEDLLGKVRSSELPEVAIIVKADTQGSCEAITESLLKLNENKKVRCQVIYKAVGGINESDMNLAETSGAVVLGFNVRAARGLDDDAAKRGVIIRYFSIIYELVDFIKAFMAGKLPPITTEVVQGHAEVRNAISVPKIGMIAGSSVLDGKITRASHLRLIRDNVVIFTGRVGSLRRFKDDVREVNHGYECGISIDGYNDIKVGDRIEAYMIEEKAATLDFNS